MAKCTIRSLVVFLILATILLPPIAAAQEDDIPLEPFEIPLFGFTGVKPADWVEASIGVYARAASPDDLTALIQQAAPGTSADQLAAALAGQIGVEALPEASETYVTDAYTWTLYTVTVEEAGITVAIDVALTDTDLGSVVVLLQASEADYDALHEAVFMPAVDALAPITEEATPPYADTAAFTEEDVTFGLEGWELPGTLTLPAGEGPFPAVVLVHGSGPNDRDEALGPNKTFRDLAWGLATQGIAVLRYDKRNFVHTEQWIEDTVTLTLDDEVTDDALAAVEFVRGVEAVDPGRVFVIGHSLGGMVAPRIGSLSPDLAGIIMMAGPARSYGEVTAAQIDYLESVGRAASELEALGEIAEKLIALDAGGDPDEVFGDDPEGHYWLSIAEYDHVATAQALEMPVLVLQGGRDYQVTMEDFALWKDALSDHEDATFISYPTLNHLFMAHGDLDRLAVPEDYAELEFVEAEVINDIASWISRH